MTCALALMVLGGLVLSFAPSTAQISGVISDDGSANSGRRVSMVSALDVGEIEGKRFANSQAMQAFYDARDNKPYWVKPLFNARADDILNVLEASWTHGLNPAHYHVEELQELDGALSLLNRTQRELLLMDGFVRYVQDLSGIRVDPKGLKVEPASWKQKLSE